jgi:Tfp pilus assembly protein PilW
MQSGLTLIEALISLALSVFVTASMVILMANSLGTATRMTQMSQMTDELRNAMSMMTRDVRRANYSPDAVKCFGNSDCGTDGSASQLAGDITIVAGNCFTFNLNRWEDVSGVQTKVAGTGGFRQLPADGSSPGWIEMWVGDSTPACNATNSDWVAVTNPDLVDVTSFVVDGSQSFTATVEEAGGTVTQKSRKISIQLEGRLVLHPDVTRRIEDIIQVRNDIFL